jgi:enediyne biosynthesis protein E7
MTGNGGCLAQDLPRFRPSAGDTEHAAIGRDYLGFLANVAGQCGDIGAYLRAGQPVVLINSPDLAQRLLIEHAGDATKGDLQHTAFRDLLGDSISLSEGGRHRMLRRLLAPVLTRRQVSRYADRITRTAVAYCGTWPASGTLDLFSELHHLTLHTLGQTLIAEPGLWDEHGLFWLHRQRLWEWITGHAGQGRRLAAGVPHVTGTEIGSVIAGAQAVIDDVIARRAWTARPPTDLLADVLAADQAAGFPLSPRDVRDQVLALLFAAHETSACALFWSLYLLDRHPDHRRRLEDELDAVLAGQVPRADDLPVLPYTARVVKEAMRLYPPAGRQFRLTASPAMLSGYLIPAQTPLTVCQYLLHRRPSSFHDPGRFDPERFSATPTAAHPLAYIPFGAGERICLGRHYAMLETRLLLALLCTRYRFMFPHPVQPQLAVTLRPHGHPEVRVHWRDRASAGPADRVEDPGSQARNPEAARLAG